MIWTDPHPRCDMITLDQDYRVGNAAIPDPAKIRIAIGSSDHPLVRRCDVLAVNATEATRIVAGIRHHEQAAMTLITLLRTLDALPLPDALVAESQAYALLQGGDDHQLWLRGRTTDPDIGGAGRVDMVCEGTLLSVHINRPEALNAITRSMRDALRAALDVGAFDPDIKQIRLTGAGRAFCMGAELTEFGTTRDPDQAHAIRMATLPALALAGGAGAKMQVHVQGACVGAGLEMAAFARTITATKNAWFQLPELAMGLIPGAGGCVSVSRRIGRQRAAAMILTGRRIGARQALNWGLIDAIV